MIIFWTANSLKKRDINFIKKYTYTDWFDTETFEYRQAYDCIINVLNQDTDKFTLVRFIEFFYAIYIDFKCCSKHYTYSNIKSEDVIPLLENIIDRDPKLFLKIRNTIFNYDQPESINDYEGIREFLDNITESYVKDNYPTEYKISNMELKLKNI